MQLISKYHSVVAKDNGNGDYLLCDINDNHIATITDEQFNILSKLYHIENEEPIYSPQLLRKKIVENIPIVSNKGIILNRKKRKNTYDNEVFRCDLFIENFKLLINFFVIISKKNIDCTFKLDGVNLSISGKSQEEVYEMFESFLYHKLKCLIENKNQLDTIVNDKNLNCYERLMEYNELYYVNRSYRIYRQRLKEIQFSIENLEFTEISLFKLISLYKIDIIGNIKINYECYKYSNHARHIIHSKF